VFWGRPVVPIWGYGESRLALTGQSGDGNWPVN